MKRFAIIVTVLALVLSMGVTGAYASQEDQQGKDWFVSFTEDEDMYESYPASSLEMADEFSTLQPGDSATFHMELRNDNQATTDWYMTNKVKDSLEATRKSASQGAYTYVLTYDGPGGEQELFNSDAIGGTQDDNQSGREGLKQATSALEDWFYLDTLASGESGNLVLTVKLEGETQGNAYQDTQAPLNMNFAVELQRTTPSRNDITWNPVRTGDETNLMLWSGIMLGCGIAALVLGIVVLKRNRKYKEENEDE